MIMSIRIAICGKYVEIGNYDYCTLIEFFFHIGTQLYY